MDLSIFQQWMVFCPIQKPYPTTWIKAWTSITKIEVHFFLNWKYSFKLFCLERNSYVFNIQHVRLKKLFSQNIKFQLQNKNFILRQPYMYENDFFSLHFLHPNSSMFGNHSMSALFACTVITWHNVSRGALLFYLWRSYLWKIEDSYFEVLGNFSSYLWFFKSKNI